MQIIAHRGTPRHHPENTLAGFAQALADGADAIELDVRRTADGVVVVHHDAASPGSPPIDTLPATALLHSIPTLAAVLALVDGRATVYVEVKQPGIEADVVGVLAGAATPAAVHAFDHRVATRVTALSPDTPTGVLMSSYVIDPVAVLRAAGARDWWQEWPMIDATLVTSIHGAGGRVIAWTVNDPQVAARLAALGVDGICTDVPGVLTQSFRAEHARTTVRVSEFATVHELAAILKLPASQIVSDALKHLNLLVTVNQRLDFDQIELIAGVFGFTVIR